MTNYPFKSISDFDDIEAKNGYKADVLTKKVTEEAYLDNLRHMSRDNARTPMQWDSSSQAGFTSGQKPWLAVNPNYTEINAAAELADAEFNLSLHSKDDRVAPCYSRAGLWELSGFGPEEYERIYLHANLGNDRYLIVLNFSKESVPYTLPGGLKPTQLVTSNLATGEVKCLESHPEGLGSSRLQVLGDWIICCCY